MRRHFLANTVPATGVIADSHAEGVIHSSVVASPSLGQICGLEYTASRLTALVGTLRVELVFIGTLSKS